MAEGSDEPSTALHTTVQSLEEETMQNLIVFGPNLGRVEETFHVHAVGCADTRKGLYKGIRLGGDQGGWTIEAASQQAVVEDIYADMIGESDPDETWQDGYAQDVRFFPCVTVPAETPEEV